MASYQAFNASMTFNSSTVAMLQNFQVTMSADMLDITSMGARWRSFQGGLASWSATAECIYEKLTGQSEMIDDIAAAAPNDAGVTVVFTLASGKTFTGVALVSNLRVQGDKADKFMASFELQGTGELVDAWA